MPRLFSSKRIHVRDTGPGAERAGGARAIAVTFNVRFGSTLASGNWNDGAIQRPQEHADPDHE